MMGKIFRFIGSRFFLGAICIFLELAQLLAVYILLYKYFLPITVLAWIFHFGVLLYLINRDEIPEFKMSWLYAADCIADMKADFLNTMALSGKVDKNRAVMRSWQRFWLKL